MIVEIYTEVTLFHNDKKDRALQKEFEQSSDWRRFCMGCGDNGAYCKYRKKVEVIGE